MIALLSVLLVAQAPPSAAKDSLAELVERARAATAVYRDRNAAIRAGYRRIGPDLPEMGQHWLQPALLVDGRFDAARPVLLNYIDIGGVPTLAGVAYALLLDGEELAPQMPNGRRWHDHTGSLTDEVIDGIGMRTGSARVAMLHAWIWIPNPAGMFAESNWALPYVRVGLTPPATIDPGASRAMSLVSGGAAYYATLLARIAPARAADFEARITAASTVARAILDRSGDSTELTQLWLLLARDLVHVAGPASAGRISCFASCSRDQQHVAIRGRLAATQPRLRAWAERDVRAGKKRVLR
jgi:hypothetical protein